MRHLRFDAEGDAQMMKRLLMGAGVAYLARRLVNRRRSADLRGARTKPGFRG